MTLHNQDEFLIKLQDRVELLEKSVFKNSQPVTETKNNTGKAHQIFYKDDWQYCFCSHGKDHTYVETIY